MKNKLVNLSAVLLIAVAAVVSASAQSRPIVRPAYRHDVSKSLAELVATAPPRPIGVGPNVEIEPPRPTGPLPGSGMAARKDTALQTAILPLVNTVPGLNFDGVSANGYAPPDTNGSVGTTQYFQMTNVEFAIYDKTNGNILLGPAQINTIWNGFGGDCSSGNGGDPAVIFDKAAQRWVVSQLSGSYNSWCMAISTSADATSTYNRYAFSSGGNLDDYPKVAVWPDAYYRATNTFTGGFVGANACAFDRASMLSGGAANEICFQQNSSVASLLPSDLDGSTAPPAGEPNFFVELYDTSDLGLFKFHVDFSNPANSTFTGPTTIPVASFNELGNSIPQPPGDGTLLDSLGDRLMFRLAYRNFGDHEALVVTHSVTAGSSSGTRWYEIRSPNATPTLFQQGTFAPDSSFRWMGSAAMDKSGDIALGYSASSSSVHPAVRYTGRVPGDPGGQMESETSIFEGTGSQTGGLSRWGDYSGTSIDPIDDCTFFYTTEYIPSDGSFNWHTRIASFKFASCGSTTPDFYLSSSPASQSVVQGKSTTYSETVNPVNGYSGTVTLSVSAGCPAGSTCTLSPTTSGPPNYPPSTLTVATSGTTPGGNYTITIQGTDGTLTHTTSVALVVIVPDFSISANTSSQTVAAGVTAKYPVTLTPLNTFTGNVTLSVSGLPANTTATYSPNPVALTYPNTSSSTLSVVTRKRTPAGTYKLTITGTSGTLTHSVTVTLGVTRR